MCIRDRDLNTTDSPTFDTLTTTSTIATDVYTVDLGASGTVTAGGFVGTPQALTDAATITYDLADGHNAKVTLTADRTLALPSNLAEGASGVLTITQDGTGGHALALAPGWFSLEGAASSISTLGPGDQAQIDWYATSSTRVNAKIKPLQFPLSSAYLYIAADNSTDLASILAGTYDLTTTDAVDGTIVVATEEGTYSAGISLDAATTYDLYSQGISLAHNGPLDTPVGYIISATPLSDGEIEQVEAHFVAEGAAPREDFGSFTSFHSTWRDCSSLSSFPLIDTSSGTDFNNTWRDCSSLTSFPLINTSLGEIFTTTWYQCSSLTSFPLIDTSSGESFSNTWNGCSGLTSFPLIDTSSGTNFNNAWITCSSLTSFPAIDTSSGTSFSQAWFSCSGLTSFPLIDTSSGEVFTSAWRDCSSLTSFPLIDTSSGTDFGSTWLNCSSLTSFPAIDTSSGTSFYRAWYGCSSLTSFPLIDTSSGTDFGSAWLTCSSLTTFPANFFDNWSPASVPTAVFHVAWEGCSSLTAQSVENILTSLDTSGIYGTNTGLSSGTQLADHTIDIDYDGTTLSSATTTAIANLKTKDWAISINSVIQ